MELGFVIYHSLVAVPEEIEAVTVTANSMCKQ